MSQAPYVGKKIEQLCGYHEISLRALCVSAGIKYQTLHAQITNNRAIPFETVRRISHATNTSMDWFSSDQELPVLAPNDMNVLSGNVVDLLFQTTKLRQAEQTQALDSHALTLIYFRSGGQITALEPFIEHVDIYYAPRDADLRLRVFRMGSESLTSKTLKGANQDQLQKSLDAAPEDLKARFLADYRRAATGEFVYSIETLNAAAADHAERVRLDYLRLLVQFHSDQHGPLIVNLSEFLR